MKLLYSTSFLSTAGKEIWSQRKEIQSSEVLKSINKNRLLEKGFYQSVHSIYPSGIIYPYLFIDIDYTDLDKSKEKTISIINNLNRLCAQTECNYFEVFFSGSKGFHILVDNRSIFESNVPTAKDFSPTLQKKFIRKLITEFFGLSMDGIDLKIYSKNRMIRSTYSLNLKSNLYKIPLTIEQISNLSIPEIQELAKNPKHFAIASMNDSLSEFINSPIKIDSLNKLLKSVQEVIEKPDTIADVDKEEIKERNKKEDPTAEFSSHEILKKCKAARQLQNRILKTNIATKEDRIALARILARTDAQKEILHKTFSRTQGYNQSLTEQKSSEFSKYSVNCDELIESGICKQKCQRYIKKDLTESVYPSYFGSKIEGKWWESTQPNNIAQTAFKLIEYHKETSDFFDWTNASQFAKESQTYSLAVSDYLRRLKIPDSTNFIVNVKKGNNTTRQLAHLHFEQELVSSILVEEIIDSNIRYKKGDGITMNVHSFGYLEKDEKQVSLIAPWRVEHQKFVKTLSSVSKDKSYSKVFSTDLKDFYPSLTPQKVATTISKVLNDKRSVYLLKHLVNAKYHPPDEYGPKITCRGLPQGPIVSHVLAARVLLEIDDLISRSFTPEEVILVRYCDDFVFFVRDENVFQKLSKEILPKIESSIGVEFHRDPSSGKSFVSTREEYVAERLESDLFKYQVRFETELSKGDVGAKRELLDLLINIFGSTFDKILSKNSSGNMKSIERQLTSIRWRVPELIEDSSELHDSIRKLAKCLEGFLSKSAISFKLQTNLILLYFTIIDNVPSLSNDLISQFVEVVDKRAADLAFIENVTLLLLRELILRPSDQFKRLSKELIAKIGNGTNLTTFQKKLLQQLSFISNSTTSFEFNEDVWGTSQVLEIPSLSNLITKLKSCNLQLSALEELFNSSQSEVIFYEKYLSLLIQREKAGFQTSTICDLYHLGMKFNLNKIKNQLIRSIEILSQKNLLPSDISSLYHSELNIVQRDISKLYAIPAIGLVVKQDIDGTPIYYSDSKHYIHEYYPYLNLSNLEKKEILDLVQRVNTTRTFGEIKFTDDTINCRFIFAYQLPPTTTGNFLAYFSNSFRIDDLMEIEIALFESLKGNFKIIPRIVLNAKHFGVTKNGNSYRHFIISISKFINSNLKGKFVDLKGKELKINIKKSMLLPGLRLMETLREKYPDQKIVEKMLGLCGISTINLVDPLRVSSVYYIETSSVLTILNSVEGYRRKLIANADQSRIDKLHYTTFLVFNKIRKIGSNLVYRKNGSMTNSFFNELNEFLSHILLETKIKNLDIGEYDCHSVATDQRVLKEVYVRKIQSVDQLSGLSLIYTYIYSREKVDKVYLPEIVFIGIAGITIYHHALNELIIRFGIASPEFNSLQTRLEQFRSDIWSLARSEFLIPVELDCSSYQKLFDVHFPKILDELKKLPMPKETSLARLGGYIDYYPPLPESEEDRFSFYSTHFRVLEISFNTTINSLTQLLLNAAEFIEEKIGYNICQRKSVKIHEGLSGIQSWQLDSEQMLRSIGVVTVGNNGRFILNAPNRKHLFIPANFKKSRLANTKIVSTIIIIILVLLLGIFADSLLDLFKEIFFDLIEKYSHY